MVMRAKDVTAAKETKFFWTTQDQDPPAIQVEIGDVTAYSGLAGSRELIDVTPYFKGNDEYENWARVRKPGLSESEDVTIEMIMVQDGAEFKGYQTLYNAMVDGDGGEVIIRFPEPLKQEVEFVAYCSRVEITGELDNVMRCSVTLGITDKLIKIQSYA